MRNKSCRSTSRWSATGSVRPSKKERQMTDGWEELRSRSHLIPIIVPDLFSVDECARILQLCEGHELQPGRIWCGESYGVDRSRRDLSTAYIPRADDTGWIYDRMDRAFFDAAAAWG